MRLVFCRNKTIWSFIIRLITLSKYSHCGIVHGNSVIQATFWQGVINTPMEEFIQHYPDHAFFNVQGVNEEKAWKWALEQLGKPYDFAALFGWFFRVKWYSEEKYFCSELTTQALYNGDKWLYRKIASRITPQDLLNLAAVEPEELSAKE